MCRRPSVHEEWCLDWGYEECTCDLEVRQAKWDENNRKPDAASLPVVQLVNRARNKQGGRRHDS